MHQCRGREHSRFGHSSRLEHDHNVKACSARSYKRVKYSAVVPRRDLASCLNRGQTQRESTHLGVSCRDLY